LLAAHVVSCVRVAERGIELDVEEVVGDRARDIDDNPYNDAADYDLFRDGVILQSNDNVSILGSR
jgi:hypothetical protein